MNVILIEGVVKGRPRVPIYSKDKRIFCPQEKKLATEERHSGVLIFSGLDTI